MLDDFDCAGGALGKRPEGENVGVMDRAQTLADGQGFDVHEGVCLAPVGWPAFHPAGFRGKG
jgi:hypothetical protein